MRCGLAALVLIVLSSCSTEDTPSTSADPYHRIAVGEPVLPADFDLDPNSEIGRRLAGTCIPFYPWGDDRMECLMTTPQDGTIGELSTETENMVAGSPAPLVGRHSDPLTDVNPGGAVPASVNHRAEYLDGCISVSNQQGCGWCTVHAATAAFEALHCSKGCDVPELSEAHLRSQSLGGNAFGSCADGWYIWLGNDAARANNSALDALVDSPIVDNATWPYVANGRGLNNNRPDDATLMRNATHRATGYTTVPTGNLAALKEALASGREILISVPVYDNTGWNSVTHSVTSPTNANPCSCGAGCGDTNCLSGYHAVVLTGYDDSTMTFQFLNSWGKDWGDGGYGDFSYSFIQSYMDSGGYLNDVDTTIPGNACEDDLPAGDGGMDGGTPDGGPTPISDRCSSFGDCASCSARSGCGWCDDSGCIANSDAASCTTVFRPSTCGLTNDSCTFYTSCGSCANSGCQWCQDSANCFDASLRSIDCYDARNAPDQCGDCSMGTDCQMCTGIGGCGWCDNATVGVVAPGATAGNCVLGGTTGPDTVECSNFQSTGALCEPSGCVYLTDCGSCLTTSGCGWCDGRDRCMPGGFWGPSPGYTCPSDWDYFRLFCDNTDASCSMEGGPCTGSGTRFDGDCCDGLICVVGACRMNEGGREQAACDSAPCAAGLACMPVGSAGATPTCCARDEDYCETKNDCCGLMDCVERRCVGRTTGQSCLPGDCVGVSFCDGSSFLCT